LFTPSYNAAPSQALPVILSTNPQAITVASWGLVPEWAAGKADVKPVINARADTVASKPFFRHAFRSKRCLVCADGFYEWKRAGKRKVPYRIAFKTGEPFAFAGIWSTVHNAVGELQTTFAILTTEANALMAPIHNRMPVILHARNETEWLNPELSIAAAQELLVPFPADILTAYEVSTRVNSPAYNTPEALQPVSQ
jgi:putative SOS response-associated peptidase YedK